MVSAIGFDPLDNGSTPLPSAKKTQYRRNVMDKKVCSTCGKEFGLENFYKCGKTKGGKTRYACECKDCRKSREIKRYYELKDDVSVFRKPCVHCGLDKPYLIEFHHRNPNEKEFVIAHWRKKSRSEFLNELKKCDPLCRNCHEEFHHLKRELGITYDEYLKKF